MGLWNCFAGRPALDESATSPPHPFHSRHLIEVAITAQQRERVLAAEGCDPEIVGGNWPGLAA
jgi:hypothetical protein